MNEQSIGPWEKGRNGITHWGTNPRVANSRLKRGGGDEGLVRGLTRREGLGLTDERVGTDMTHWWTKPCAANSCVSERDKRVNTSFLPVWLGLTLTDWCQALESGRSLSSRLLQIYSTNWALKSVHERTPGRNGITHWCTRLRGQFEPKRVI